MDPRADLCDEGLVRCFGDAMHEMPELYEAIRLFEFKNRPAVTSGGFRIKSDWVSVSVDGAAGHVSWIRVGNARS
jgi:hypothetical protein